MLPTPTALADAWAKMQMIKLLLASGEGRRSPGRILYIVLGAEEIPPELHKERDALEADLRIPREADALRRELIEERAQNHSDCKRWGERREEWEEERRRLKDRHRELARAAGYAGDTSEHADVLEGVLMERRDLLRRAKGRL